MTFFRSEQLATKRTVVIPLAEVSWHDFLFFFATCGTGNYTPE
ncbi:MAG: hypothetical protein ACI9MZ_001294, partial [Porticoccaceae bacterium]